MRGPRTFLLFASAAPVIRCPPPYVSVTPLNVGWEGLRRHAASAKWEWPEILVFFVADGQVFEYVHLCVFSTVEQAGGAR